MKELFKVTVEADGGLPTLRYRFDQRAWQRLQRTLLGKTLPTTPTGATWKLSAATGLSITSKARSAP